MLSTSLVAADKTQYPNVRFQQLMSKQGVRLGPVDAMLQDRQGFIWLGGQNGLVRYDGYELKVYRNQYDADTSLSNNAVWDIVEDEKGNIWVATEGGLNYLDRESDKFKRYLMDDSNSSSILSNDLRALLIDNRGNVWVGSYGRGISVLDVKTQAFRHHQHDRLNDRSLSDNVVWELFEDSGGTIWIGTENGGLNRFDKLTGHFKRYQYDPNRPHSISGNTVRAITEDTLGGIWIGTDSGLNHFDKYKQKFTWYQHNKADPASIGGNIIWDIFEDRYGYIWVGTDGGGFNMLDTKEGKFIRHTFDKNNPFTISSNVVRKIMEDHSGDLWTGNFPMGVNIFHRASENISLIQHDVTNPNSLNHPSVLSISMDKGAELWVGTDGGGLNHLDLSSGVFTHFKNDPTDETSISANAILTSALDKDGELWIGTWGGALNKLNRANKSFIRYPSNISDPGTPSHANIWAILSDSKGDLWIGTEGGGLNFYDRKNDRFIRYAYGENREDTLFGEIVWDLFEDRQKNFWIGTNKGLSLYDRATGKFRHFVSDGREGSLSNSTVLTIFQDKQDRIWLGTRSGLNLLDLNTGTFKVYRESDGLASDLISSIQEDSQGRLWLGTANGIIQFDPKLLSIRNYDQSQWGSGKYNDNAAIINREGKMMFGGVNGITVFDPSDVKDNLNIPQIAITDFQIFNQSQKIGAKDSPLQKAITETDEIVLNYKQSVFSFTFASLNYDSPEKNQYAYRLEGFENNWREVGNDRKATYTNLDDGHYEFRVRGSNNQGVWNEGGKSIKLRILPPPWRTWWAYTLYCLTVLSIISLYVRSQKIKIRQEREINQRLRQIDKLKDDFLANTSHELRTPLNGIIGLAESLVDGAAGELPDVVKSNLKMIAGSGKRLASLVNDILDFSKLKDRQIVLAKEPLNIHMLTNVVLTMSRPLVGSKKLELVNDIPEDVTAIKGDENRIQQVLYNLVGNAIKFTIEGRVSVSAEVKGDMLWVRVKDTGIGIPQEKQHKIFESFEQIEDHENRRHGGTGLGLTITKQLVELHGGVLQVESAEGVGSTFSFSLDITDEIATEGAYGDPENQVSMDLYNDEYMYEDVEEQSLPSFSDLKTEAKVADLQVEIMPDGQSCRIFRILIVDDEFVNRQVLINQLSLQKNYQTYEASNGMEALRFIEDNGEKIDLILLDIMMPQMSGYEVCTQIRRKYSMNQLPIIFLTAKNLISDLVDGFEVGANDFLTKPVSKGELKSRVRTHLQLLDINNNLDTKVKSRTSEVEEANRVLETLDDIVASINQEVIMDRLLEVLLSEAVALFPKIQRTLYWHYNESDNKFYCLGMEGGDPAKYENMTVPADILNSRYVEHGEALSDGIYLCKPKASTPGATIFDQLPLPRSLLAMKMDFEDSLVGYLVLISDETDKAFEGCDLNTFIRFSSHSKSALSKVRLVEMLQKKNEILEDVSFSDHLTGLRNRRYLLKYLDSDIALTLRQYRYDENQEEVAPNSDLLFFMLDIDKFKDINDKYGHSAGDQMLVHVKDILEKVFRTSDFLIRWGGEEFLVVARFCNRDAAPLMAERLRATFENQAFRVDESLVLRGTCSIGFACFPFVTENPDEFSWAQVVDIADHCLYLAKRQQRNAWVGLGAEDGSLTSMSFQRILNNTQDMIDDGELTISASFDTKNPLAWK